MSADITPSPGDPWLPAQNQNPTSDSFRLGRHPNDVRCVVDPATAMYTDLDTGEVRTWWQQRQYLQARNMRYARSLSAVRQVNSDQQALWGRKPEFYDDWFGGYIPEYRLPNPTADLTQLNAVYGGPGPWPNGPLPSGGY